MTTSTIRAALLAPAALATALLLAACGNQVAGGSGTDLPVLHIGARAATFGDTGSGAPDDPYPLVGTLPTGPSTAAVLRYGSAPVPAATVTRLAAALGLSGSATRHAHGVVVDSRAGTLNVRDGGQWSFWRTDDLCPSQRVDVDSADPDSLAVGCAVSPPGTATPAKPVDPRRTAEPVLAAAGVGTTTADVDDQGEVAVVSVDPVVASVPTTGIATAVLVDARGVRSAYGVLGEAAEGPAYPVITAAQALSVLRSQPRPELAIACAVGQTCPGVGPQKVTGATLGLMAASDSGERILVPAWLFAIEGSSVPAAVVAVVDRYLADPEPVDGGGGSSSVPGSSGGAVPPSDPGTGPEPGPTASDLPLPVGSPTAYQVTSYAVSADGTTLTLRTEGGVCTDYAGAAVETARSVTVSIQGTWNQATDVACPAIAKVVEVPVALRTPLGGRTVVDERTGAAVPKA